MSQPLLPLLYFPPVAWLALLWRSEQVTLEACENYQKGSLPMQML